MVLRLSNRDPDPQEPRSAYRAPGLTNQNLVRILREHRQVLLSGGAGLIQGRHWRPVTRVECEGASYAVKQYARGSMGARLRRLAFGSRALRAARRCRRLLTAGIPAAAIAAVLESPAPHEPESYLITHWVPGPHPSERIRALRDHRDEAGWQQLLEQAGRWLGRTHRRSIWLNDCWDGNFVVAGDGRLVLVDCDSVHFRHLGGPQQLRNLRQLYRGLRAGDNHADQCCFARAYLTALGLPGGLEPELARNLLALLAVPSHEGILAELCREHWSRMRRLAGGPRLGPRRGGSVDA